MSHFIAIIEDGDETHAAGVWFPDLPGCFSAGDTLDEALLNAPEALRLHIESLMEDGADIPSPRRLSAIKADPAMQDDLAEYMVAVIPLTISIPPRHFLPAAE